MNSKFQKGSQLERSSSCGISPLHGHLPLSLASAAPRLRVTCFCLFSRVSPRPLAKTNQKLTPTNIHENHKPLPLKELQPQKCPTGPRKKPRMLANPYFQGVDYDGRQEACPAGVSHRRTTATSVSRSMGLVAKSSQPAARHS